jgi:predicted RecB family nuclease
MRQLGRRLTFSPSELNAYLECAHLARLTLAGEKPPAAVHPQAELIRRKGEEHEAGYLARLRAEGRGVVEISFDFDWDAAARATEDAMRSGVDVVYQACLVDSSGWRGFADFLELQPDGSYEAADTKLARTPKPYYLLQLAFYSEQVGRIQGRLPERMHVVLGTDERESYRVRDFDAYYRRVRERFLRFAADPPETYPEPVSHCPICDWNAVCITRRQRDDHLSLVANMRRRWREQLVGGGVATMAALATATEPGEVRAEVFERIRRQAELQVGARATGRHRYELLPNEPKRGLAALPKPSPGDLFFDIEGDPFYEPARGLEYLFGVTDSRGDFTAYWGTDRAGERTAFEQTVDRFTAALAADPALHVYHYAPYEVSALKRLAAEHGTREDEVDELLRREVFADLYRVVSQSLLTSHPRYGLKEIETFFMPPRQEDVRAGDDSIVVFEQWRESGDQGLLDAIERYNEFDCLATLKLREWLLERRDEAGVTEWKEPPPPRPISEEAAEAATARERLRDERWLAAQLLEYHRREARPEWWHYFRRKESTPEELVYDSEAIGLLEPTGDEPEQVKQSKAITLRFPPQQHKLGPGGVEDPETGRGEAIVAIDDALGVVTIRRGKQREDDPLPRALIPGGPYNTKEQRAALGRLGAEILCPSGRYGALRAIVRRDLPRARLDGGAAEAALSLDSSYLFVQGPPGSGKTWTGARLIVDLLREGRKVGIGAPTHKAIHNLLREVERVARDERFEFKGLKKHSGDDESKYEGPFVESTADIAALLDPEVRLVAGTAWVFSREELDQQLDVLVLDEAGQLSLADALAMGTSARNVVLLGDPLQLAQVSQGTHPAGAGASVLEHLLGEDATVPPERGIFLAETWRMHPGVCGFVSEIVYDSRLEPAPGRERQSVGGAAGLRYLPVEHDGNAQSSVEEAERIAAEVEALVGLPWRDVKGRTRPLRYDDVLVVAPYNAQVRTLRGALPEAVRVGTVDKFQGQEAPVVFYSTASSSGEDVPRGLDFLFSRNRLNVAISRAQCVAYLVGSPRLLEARARTVETMRLVNAMCRFVELAEPAEPAV